MSAGVGVSDKEGLATISLLVIRIFLENGVVRLAQRVELEPQITDQGPRADAVERLD